MKIFYLIFSLILLASCSGHSNDASKSEEDVSIKDDEDDEKSSRGNCGFKDGTYSANVDYHNPETGYSQAYTLDVEVDDCQIVQIDFPKGGWLDEDHITVAELDQSGDALVDGEEGRTYDVHIEN